MLYVGLRNSVSLLAACLCIIQAISGLLCSAVFWAQASWAHRLPSAPLIYAILSAGMYIDWPGRRSSVPGFYYCPKLIPGHSVQGVVTLGDYDGVVSQVDLSSGHWLGDRDEHDGRRYIPFVKLARRLAWTVLVQTCMNAVWQPQSQAHARCPLPSTCISASVQAAALSSEHLRCPGAAV